MHIFAKTFLTLGLTTCSFLPNPVTAQEPQARAKAHASQTAPRTDPSANNLQAVLFLNAPELDLLQPRATLSL